MSVDSMVAQFHVYLLTEKRVSGNTFQAYKRDLKQFIAYLKKKKYELHKLTLKDLKSFLHHLHKLQLSARSVSRKISCLKLFFRYLHNRHKYKDLAKGLHFPKLEKKLPQYLSEKEIETLIQTVRNAQDANAERNKIMVYLLYTTGMRVSELINLQKHHIQFDEGHVVVHGKGGKERLIPLPDGILSLINSYIDTEHKKLEKQHKNTTDFLFPVWYAKKVKPISRQSFWGILKKLCKKAGIHRPISPHQLRHSLATHMLKKGADLRSLQMLLGHENLSTVEVYTHIETSYLRKIYDKKHPRS